MVKILCTYECKWKKIHVETISPMGGRIMKNGRGECIQI
jgi:hypothetical protein